jgi:hypothetical protein
MSAASIITSTRSDGSLQSREPIGRPQFVRQPRVQVLRQIKLISSLLFRNIKIRSQSIYASAAVGSTLPISWPQKRANTEAGSCDGC